MMPMWLHSFGLGCGAFSLAGAFYWLAAAWAAGRFSRAVDAGGGHPAVSLLKPLHGVEPKLRENLETFCRQNYDAAVQIVFGVQGAADTAIGIVEEVKQAHPDLDIALVVDARVYGSNRKISNLINMMPAAKHDTLVLSDSDISVAPGYLRAVIASLRKGGAVTCLYRGVHTGNVWSRLVAMGINYQFAPNVLFATASGLDAPCFGSTIALRRDLLQRIGGFEAFADLLADDYELGRAVRAAGEPTRLAPVIVAHSCAESHASETVAHELRWARTIRLLNWKGHLGSVVIHAMPLALVAVALAPGPFTLSALAAAMAARAVLKLRMDKVLGAGAGSVALLPLRDLLSFAIFVGSLYGGSVRWRGRRFAVTSNGVLFDR